MILQTSCSIAVLCCCNVFTDNDNGFIEGGNDNTFGNDTIIAKNLLNTSDINLFFFNTLLISFIVHSRFGSSSPLFINTLTIGHGVFLELFNLELFNLEKGQCCSMFFIFIHCICHMNSLYYKILL